MTADASRLLDHARRRAIACAVLDTPLTVGEIADELRTKDGAIRTMVDYLASEGVLTRSDRPGRRAGATAAEYRVASAHLTMVRERCRDAGAPTLDENGEILLVPLAGLALAAGVLARDRPAAIAWAVRTRDPQLALMLGLRRDSTPDERDALLIALREDGVDCARLHLGEVFAAPDLIEYAGKLATTRTGLPSGE